MSTPLFTSMSMYTYVSGDAGLDVCYVHVGVDVHYVYFHVRVHVHVYVYGAVGLDVCYVQLGVDVYIYIHICLYVTCKHVGHVFDVHVAYVVHHVSCGMSVMLMYSIELNWFVLYCTSRILCIHIGHTHYSH